MSKVSDDPDVMGISSLQDMCLFQKMEDERERYRRMFLRQFMLPAHVVLGKMGIKKRQIG